MGKRRKGSNTGGRAPYKSRDLKRQGPVVESVADDPMHNEVDRFHNDRDKDFLRLDADAAQSEEGEDQEEAVMDLGVGDDSEEESSSSEEDEHDALADEEEQEQALSSDGDDGEEFDMEQVRDWGRKKTSYYHGDTADLEIGQNEEDAYLEEEAAKEVAKARYENMSEEDFVLSDTEAAGAQRVEAPETFKTVRDIGKLSLKEKRKLLDSQHPEFLPILSHFSDAVEELHTSTSKATTALFESEDGAAEAVGSTKMGQRYLLTKALLQSTVALNLAMYLMLKAEQTSDATDGISLIQSHPVLTWLKRFNALNEQIDQNVESKVDGLKVQLENLTKAAELVQSGEQISDEKSESSSSSSSESNSEENESVVEAETVEEVTVPTVGTQAAQHRSVLNEARFGYRATDVDPKATLQDRKRRRAPLDFGDAVDAEPSKALVTTLNSIEQRSATRARKAVLRTEDVDEYDDDDDREGYGGLEDFGMGTADKLGVSAADDDGSDGIDPELEGDGDVGFYAQVSKKSRLKKEARTSKYQVLPKFPRPEVEVDGERAISRTILKNRGLVAHKSKLNRNPRVKKREQYRKALIRRKGAVREVRTDEGHKYGGEQTGIKSGLSRSRRLA